MATKTTRQSDTVDEYDQMFADWVYQVPGVVLIAMGFGGMTLLTVF
ncbi:MAG: hypothetical protein ABEJ48_03300 [Halobacteriales archaeon]